MDLNKYLKEVSDYEEKLKKLNEEKVSLGSSAEVFEEQLNKIDQEINNVDSKLINSRKIVDTYNIISEIRKSNEKDLENNKIKFYKNIENLPSDIKKDLINNFENELEKTEKQLTNNLFSFHSSIDPITDHINISKIVSSLNEFELPFSCYNEQIDIIKNIEDQIQTFNIELDKYNKVGKQEIEDWYYSDIPIKTRNSLSFDEYKNKILNTIDEDINNRRKNIRIKTDEYYSNLYYLEEIKNDLKKSLNDKKIELIGKLRREDKSLNELMDEAKDFSKKNNSYGDLDRLLRLTAELNYKLGIVDEYIDLIKFSEGELEFISNGLSKSQKEIYNRTEKKYNIKNKIDIDELKSDINIATELKNSNRIFIEKIEHKPELTWVVARSIEHKIGSDSTVVFTALSTGEIIMNSIVGVVAVDDTLKNSSTKIKRLNGEMEVSNIELPSTKLKLSLSNFKKHLNSEDGLKQISLLFTSAISSTMAINKLDAKNSEV